jgi:hypothetical protein
MIPAQKRSSQGLSESIDINFLERLPVEYTNIYTLSGLSHILEDILNLCRHWSSEHLQDANRGSQRTPTSSRLLNLQT